MGGADETGPEQGLSGTGTSAKQPITTAICWGNCWGKKQGR